MKLVYLNANKPVTDSLTVAEIFEKNHRDVMRNIDNIIKKQPEWGARNFAHTHYKHEQNGQEYRKYIISEKGFSVLVMGFSGDKALEFKTKYADEFENMREAIQIKQSSEWLQTRKQGKLVRREETDVLAELILYAKERGSKNANMFYVNYTKLVNKAVGLQTGQREMSTDKVLSTIAMIEDMIIHTVGEGMKAGLPYKSIYQQCKAKTEGMMQYVYLPEQRLLLKGGE